MLTRFLAARVRRAYHDGEHCAICVDCRYLEPFGEPTWAVWIVRLHHADHEAARSRSLLLALWRAWRAAP